MHQPRRFLTLLLPLLLMTVVVVAAVPLTSLPPVASEREQRSFRDVMYPRLVSLSASVDTVESLVAERSRNVVALQAHANKIEKLTEQIDGYLASPDYQGDYPTVVAHYLAGRDSILSAISGAREALQSFDFSTLPELVSQFDRGSEELNLAVALLEESESTPQWRYTSTIAVR